LNLKQRQYPIFKYKFLQNMLFLQKKISLETLSNMLTTQSGNFQKFEFESLAGIVSNTSLTKIGENQITVKITAPVRLVPVAMLVDVAVVEPSPLCPDPSREKGRRRGRQRPGPPLFFPSSLHVADHRDLASTDPQHSAAETTPLQHASKSIEAGVTRARRQHNLRWPPTGRPCPRLSGL
jgi:hypothetical protein